MSDVAIPHLPPSGAPREAYRLTGLDPVGSPTLDGRYALSLPAARALDRRGELSAVVIFAGGWAARARSRRCLSGGSGRRMPHRWTLKCRATRSLRA